MLPILWLSFKKLRNLLRLRVINLILKLKSLKKTLNLMGVPPITPTGHPKVVIGNTLTKVNSVCLNTFAAGVKVTETLLRNIR